MDNKITRRQKKEKELLIENLKRIPIVEIACQKSGVARATYYRWKQKSVVFAKQADEAIEEGIKLINDMAESQLLSSIKEGNTSAVFYWLNHRHSAYGNKVEITTNNQLKDTPLTEEQKDAIKTALGVLHKEGDDKNENKTNTN